MLAESIRAIVLEVHLCILTYSEKIGPLASKMRILQLLPCAMCIFLKKSAYKCIQYL
jgi:hypothetical protein